MTTHPLTVKALAVELDRMAPDLPLAITAGGTALADGFHVTEIGHARVDSLDCGGRRLSWEEAVIQILDSGTGRPMTVATLRGIVGQALSALPGMADLDLRIEANTGNAGLRRYSLAGTVAAEGVARMTLTPVQAHCKPLVEAVAAGHGDCRQVGCCA